VFFTAPIVEDDFFSDCEVDVVLCCCRRRRHRIQREVYSSGIEFHTFQREVHASRIVFQTFLCFHHLFFCSFPIIPGMLPPTEIQKKEVKNFINFLLTKDT